MREHKRCVLFGLSVDALDMDAVVEQCKAAIASRQRLLIGVINAAKVVNLRRDDVLRTSLLECDLLLADGQSVVWGSRMLGKPLPERVAGIDLFQRLLTVASEERRSIYLLGASTEVLELLQANIRQSYPGLTIAGARDGYFPDEEADDVAAAIRAAGADMLFLGMTSPKKEIFLGRYGDSLRVPVQHGVGGSFDILAGVTKRAPRVWQRLGCEWLYRVVQEPRRLWKRYLTTNTAFLQLVLREMARPTPAYASMVTITIPAPRAEAASSVIDIQRPRKTAPHLIVLPDARPEFDIAALPMTEGA
jgi:N-acetylglucosaminyldiphosphoundecaprenol N-acetyl-beta-D-mannosaminyltransferase